MAENAVSEQEIAAAAEAEARELAIAVGDIIPDEEDKPETEEAEEVAAEPEKKDDYVAPMIPKQRLDEVSAENRALKDRIATLEALEQRAPATTQPSDYELAEERRDALQQRADEMLIEGDIEDRKPLLREIREIDKALVRADMQNEMRQMESVSTLKQVVDQAQRDYDFLNPDSENFDSDAVSVLNARQAELINTGQSAAVALQNAINEKADKLARMSGLEKVMPDKGQASRESRNTEARKKAADASINQPAGMPLQADRDKFLVNTATMTAKQILALPEADRAKAMGDVL